MQSAVEVLGSASDRLWHPQPEAARVAVRAVETVVQRLPAAAAFAGRLHAGAGVRLGDLVETIRLSQDNPLLGDALASGWCLVADAGGQAVYANPHGIFPQFVACRGHSRDGVGIDVKVDSVADFAVANGLSLDGVAGGPMGPWRRLAVFQTDDACLAVSERHGCDGHVDDPASPDLLEVLYVTESFRTRDRSGHDDAFDRLDRLVDNALARVGRNHACDAFFAADREFWQRRNAAARFQKGRQDALGIGWANHDHHTYRSSRRHFRRLVALWEKLGFVCRERFYPGPEAGWGAQVMEQPVCRVVTFNDVDISPDELVSDFAHVPMDDRDSLATVGLWCGLHGESVLAAGMHHLECTFDFEALREQFARDGGIELMPKFTDFPHLKQAFTKGERWAVDPERIDALLSRGLITEHQAKEFRLHGALGSHLENLERNDGFKGFNQTGVTDIIRRTDPRHAEEPRTQ